MSTWQNKREIHWYIKFGKKRENMEVAAKKVFICEECERSFNRKSNFIRHYRVHQSKVQKVVCTVCFKTYANVSNLKAHFLDYHRDESMPVPKTITVPNKSNVLYAVWHTFKLIFTELKVHSNTFDNFIDVAVEMADKATQTNEQDLMLSSTTHGETLSTEPNWKKCALSRYQQENKH